MSNRIRASHDLDDLVRDLNRINESTARQGARAVRESAQRGARLARGFATRSAGEHGKHYPEAIGAEPLDPLRWEYGPDANHPKGQGGMSFERGSRNQKAHLDLARSADVVGAELARKVGRIVDRVWA